MHRLFRNFTDIAPSPRTTDVILRTLLILNRGSLLSSRITQWLRSISQLDLGLLNKESDFVDIQLLHFAHRMKIHINHTLKIK